MSVTAVPSFVFLCPASWTRHLSGCFVSVFFLSAFCFSTLHAQTPASTTPTGAPQPDSQRMADIEQRLNTVTDALSQTQQELQKSQMEIQKLRAQLDALRAQTTGASNVSAATPQTVPSNAAPPTSSSAPDKDYLRELRDEQGALQAEVKQHEQIKVETTSKYPLRVSGLALFNAFTNVGVVDNVELPTFALPRLPNESHGSTGATLRQTILGLEATGPRLGGARSSANISLDFFGGVASNSYGYSSSTGLVRMREAQLGLTWDKTTVQGGYEVPLITPLSPTSYATVAHPGLAGSGNLWTWSPEIRVEQRFPLSDQSRIALEGGLVSPQSPGYTSDQLDSPVEASRQPGYEGRVSYHAHDDPASGVAHPFVLGFGAYSANQFYNSATRIHSWAITADWQIPIFKWLELTGEAYRGRALGGFGGGEYKDILTGIDTTTGLTRSTGVDTIGGWSQLKLRFGETLEANAAFGLDNAFSRAFDGLNLSGSTYPLQENARNNSVVGNIIYRPKTYLIFSPEYRRIQSWNYTGPANIANVFTITAGYQF